MCKILAVVSSEKFFSSSFNDRYSAMLSNKIDPDLQMSLLVILIWYKWYVQN